MRHRQTKGPVSARPHLHRRATPRLHLKSPQGRQMSVMAMLKQSPWPSSDSIYCRPMDRTFIDRPASESEHHQARDVAHAVLAGRTTVLEAVRALVFLAHTDAIADVEDRRLIISIDSETDHLPVGEVRKLWAPSALREKDVEISRAEEVYRSDFLETCRRIANPNGLVNE
jgi:hypothetical protein